MTKLWRDVTYVLLLIGTTLLLQRFGAPAWTGLALIPICGWCAYCAMLDTRALDKR